MLPAISPLAPEGWPLLVLVSGRVAGMMMIAPLWSLRAIPGKVRGAIAVVVALLLVPLAPPVTLATTLPGLLLMVGGEMLLGLVIGLTAAVFVHGVTIAGEVIAMQMGLSLGAALGAQDLGSPGIGELKTLFTIVLYVAAGGHLMLLAGVARSLTVIPPGAPLDLLRGVQGVVALAGTAFVVASRIAAPAIAALLLANLTLAILNKAVPQLNTMMVAFPVTIALGLLVLAASLPYIAGFVSSWAATLGQAADQIVQPFVPLPAGS